MAGLAREQVTALAPDAASVRAATGLALPTAWTTTGRDEEAVWGECPGGSGTYRATALAAGTDARCTCPSRKWPCKHALALLLLDGEGVVPAVSPPPRWVTAWLSSREGASRARARGRPPSTGAPAARTTAEADRSAAPGAQERRRDRERRVDAGVEQMRRWLADLVRGGLATAASRPPEHWEAAARRAVDAGARGLAEHVRTMADLVADRSRPDWPERLVDEVGATALLHEAWVRRDALPQETREALAVRVGLAQSGQDVRATGERVTDEWDVVGSWLEDDGRLLTLRQWAVGARTGRVVQALSFGAAGRRPEAELPRARGFAGTLALHPGTRPPRARLVERGPARRLRPLVGAPDLDATLGVVAEALAVDPWAETTLLQVAAVRVIPPGTGARGGTWHLADRRGRCLPLHPGGDPWVLLAVSGGEAVDVAAEWDGFALRALAVGRPGHEPVTL